MRTPPKPEPASSIPIAAAVARTHRARKYRARAGRPMNGRAGPNQGRSAPGPLPVRCPLFLFIRWPNGKAPCQSGARGGIPAGGYSPAFTHLPGLHPARATSYPDRLACERRRRSGGGIREPASRGSEGDSIPDRHRIDAGDAHPSRTFHTAPVIQDTELTERSNINISLESRRFIEPDRPCAFSQRLPDEFITLLGVLSRGADS